jgi:hypothetical protein
MCLSFTVGQAAAVADVRNRTGQQFFPIITSKRSNEKKNGTEKKMDLRQLQNQQLVMLYIVNTKTVL